MKIGVKWKIILIWIKRIGFCTQTVTRRRVIRYKKQVDDPKKKTG